ncbi:MAG: DUF4139 domain-containing protein [Pseudomonadota bacterium]
MTLAISAATATADTAITIYSKAQPGAVDPALYRPTEGDHYPSPAVPGYAIVRQDKTLSIEKGRSEIKMTDVAALIDPTTVRFESLTDPEGLRVLEQDFRFDLVGTRKLLSKFIDQEIQVFQGVGDSLVETKGRLLSTDGGLVLERDDGSVSVLSDWQNVSLGALPGGLMTRPTLVWDLNASRGGEHKTRLSYETKGTTWWADYNLLWTPEGDGNTGTLGVGAWVSVLNQSGASYDNAKLKLIAGDVQRAEANVAPQPEMAMMRSAAVDLADSGFDEKALFEFHLYTLDRPTSIPNNATKQIELFAQVAAVPARKRLIYSPSGTAYFGSMPRYLRRNADKVNAFIEFDNSRKNGLGIPLPAGRVRVSQLDDADQSIEFIGEDIIDHTPRNESLNILVGSAFDVLGARSVTASNRDNSRRVMEETVEITLTNRKTVAQPVTVLEQLNRSQNSEILEASDRYEKEHAFQIAFEVTVPADSKKTIRYRVRYTW